MNREWVLVVSASERRRALLVAQVRAAGFLVECRPGALEASEFLSAQPACSLALGDAAVGSEPFALLERVGATDPGVAVVLALECADMGRAVESFRSGAVDVVLDTADPRHVRDVLRRALGEARRRSEGRNYRLKLERLLNERTGQLLKMMSDLEHSYDVTIEAMGDALDLRDEDTEGHSKRVTAYAVALGRHMRLSASQLQTMARGALLHDIGKIAVPDAILLKPGRLTPAEMAIMRRHCEHGYSIVRKIPFLSDAAEIVYAHQERFDGNGYPRGLRGYEIPLGARIFAIADTLDAITSDRPYRNGSSFAHALMEIERCRGGQFDPEVVDAFLEMPRGTWPAIQRDVGRHSHAGELVRLAAAA
jgi:putative nucleotidyltransferase with HDIG domain